MKIINLKKLPILLTASVFFVLLFCNTSVYASDYQYKVLDKKYNPAAEKLINGTLETETEKKPVKKEKEKFDFLRLFALLALLMLPTSIVQYSCKAFVKVTKELKEKGYDYVEEPVDLKETEKENQEQEEEKEEITAVKKEDLKTDSKQLLKNSSGYNSTKKTNTKSTAKSVAKAVSNSSIPIQSGSTVMIDKIKLTKNKGLCLVQHKEGFALIGYINEKVFLLKKFAELKTQEIRPRWTETVNEKDRYIIRLGTSYKALIEVSNDNINLLIEL